MRARHPSEPPGQLVARRRSCSAPRTALAALVRGLRRPAADPTRASTVVLNSSPGVTCRTSLVSQCGGPSPLIVRRDLVLHQRRVPLVGENRRPQQPQPLPRIDEHRRVRVGIARRVGQQERGAPRVRCPCFSRAPRTTTSSAVRSPEPWNQHDEQVAVRRLDDHRRVVVPVLEREDELRGMERTVGGLARHDRNAADR